MGYNVSVYSFYGIRIQFEQLINYFSFICKEEILSDGYSFDEEAEEWITQVKGLDNLFKKHFGYNLGIAQKGENPSKYYLIVNEARLVYKYNTDSTEYEELPYELDISELSPPTKDQNDEIKAIMSKLKVDEYKISPWVICDESY